MPGKSAKRQDGQLQPLAKCRVLYIGSAVPLETTEGLESLQLPLRERYPVNAEEFQGIDAWLTIFSSGIQLQYVEDQTTVVWFPIGSLYVCSAVKAVSVLNGATGQRTSRFIALDGGEEIKNSQHPPIFAAIMRRTKGVKVLECHGFISQSEQAAMALVASCSYAFEQRGEDVYHDNASKDYLQKSFNFEIEDEDSEYRQDEFSDASSVMNRRIRHKGANDTIRDTTSEIVDRGYFYGGTEHLVGNYAISQDKDSHDLHQFQYRGRPAEPPRPPPHMRAPTRRPIPYDMQMGQPLPVALPPMRPPPPHAQHVRRGPPQMPPQMVRRTGNLVVGPPPPPHAMRYHRGAPPPPPMMQGIPPGLIPIGPANVPPHLYLSNAGHMRSHYAGIMREGRPEGPVLFMPPPPPPPPAMIANHHEDNYIIRKDGGRQREEPRTVERIASFSARLPRQPLPDKNSRHRHRSASSSSSSSSRERDLKNGGHKSRRKRSPHGGRQARKSSSSADSNDRHHSGRPRSPPLDYADKKYRERRDKYEAQKLYTETNGRVGEELYSRVIRPVDTNAHAPPPPPPPPPPPLAPVNGNTRALKNGRNYDPEPNGVEEMYYHKNTDPYEKTEKWVTNGERTYPGRSAFGFDENFPNAYRMNEAVGAGESRDDLDEDNLPRRRPPMDTLERDLGFYP